MSLDCPIGCEEATLNPKFDECTQSLHFGEIEEIAVAKNSFVGFTDVYDEDEWAEHISEGDIEILVVKATLDEPDREEIESTKGSTIYTKPVFNVPFQIHDLTTENFVMVKNSFCNTKHKVWLRSATLVHGGNSGFANASFKMYVAHEEGTNSLVKVIGNVRFISQTQEVGVIGSSIS